MVQQLGDEHFTLDESLTTRFSKKLRAKSNPHKLGLVNIFSFYNFTKMLSILSRSTISRSANVVRTLPIRALSTVTSKWIIQQQKSALNVTSKVAPQVRRKIPQFSALTPMNDCRLFCRCVNTLPKSR
jgi:hypothetical protein